MEEKADLADIASGELAEPIPEPERRSWRERLTAESELDRYDGLLAILGEDQAELLRTVPLLPPAERDRLLEVLFLQADLLLLEGRDRARPIFVLACAQSGNPALREAWRQLVVLYRPADPAAPLDKEKVAQILAATPGEELRGALARALLIHPNTEVRALAREAAETADCWNVVASESTPWRVLYEIWQGRRGKSPDDFFKIFLSCLAGRFLGELGREQIGMASRFLFAVLQVEVFQERTYRQVVLSIENNLRAQALKHGIDLGLENEYRHRVQTFSELPPATDQPIQGWSKVPLSVQRLLARRGLYLRHFCSHASDAVALECFPHLLLRRDEVVEFLKILTINARLLAQLAEEKHLYESDAAKFFLLANPRCPFHIIGKYMGYLTSESLTKLAQGYLYNTFARKQAERLLEQRGKAKKAPEATPQKGRR